MRKNIATSTTLPSAAPSLALPFIRAVLKPGTTSLYKLVVGLPRDGLFNEREALYSTGMSQRARVGMLAESVVYCTVMPYLWPRIKHSFGINIGADKTNSFPYRFEIRERAVMSKTAHMA